MIELHNSQSVGAVGGKVALPIDARDSAISQLWEAAE